MQNNIIDCLEYWGEFNKDKIALIDENAQLCYGELLSKARAVASSIAAFGFNIPIIVKVARNIDTILAFLGVAMSGNYYVPIDECITDDKLESIINTSGAKYLIDTSTNSCINTHCTNTQDGLIEKRIQLLSLPRLLHTHIDLKLLKSVRERFSDHNPLYLIYTSGSTGIPKGVLKTHHNVFSFVDSFIKTFNMDKNEIIASQAPFSFDASAKDIYLTLFAGSTLCIVPKQLFLFPTKLIEYLNINKVTFLCWVPSALTLIVKMKALSFIKPLYLKRVFFVGEVFQPKYLNVLLSQLPDIEFFNLYGSTEIAGVCLYYKTQYPLPDDKPIPLGCPLAGNTVFLCDEEGNKNVDEGEICVISDQIAVGYINDSQKNSLVFLTNNDGQKVLKTGDYAIFDNQRNLVFLSRKDFQIKHMGYRIELQEIELAITALPYIESSCCLYQEASQKICAFIVLNQQIENATKTILTDLKQRLQPYMMPARLSILDTMPLNSNGKIDRTTLKELL